VSSSEELDVPARVAVFGSLNHDLTFWVPRPPAPDETLRAHRVAEHVGGKGANQAVAAARLGAATSMIGRVGSDSTAPIILDHLRADGVDVSAVGTVSGPTGMAVPIVSDDGQVSIIIAAGANGAVGPGDADAAAAIIEAADVVLLQGEVSSSASAQAAAIAREAGKRVVFNAAPVPDRADLILACDPLVVVNAHEALELKLQSSDEVIVTLGGAGVQVGDTRVGAFPTEVVDPTGAGDAFCAALAVALVEGAELLEAVRFASAAGACAVRFAGAQPSVPTRAAVDQMLAGNGS
jgi:ribokinase